jgi:hypothetical protein
VIVVDANVLVYLFVAGAGSGKAERVLRRDPVWAAPLLWRSEFRNALLGIGCSTLRCAPAVRRMTASTWQRLTISASRS